MSSEASDMSQHRRVQQLQAIEEVREMQRLAAEIEAMRHAREVEALSQAQKDSLRRLEDAEAGWRQSIARGLLGDQTALAWSQAVVQETGRLAEADERLAAARATSAKARRGWDEATARRRLAGQFAVAASRKLRLRREELRSAELVDQYLIRRDLP